MPTRLRSELEFNTSVLLVTDDHQTNRALRNAFASAAPRFTLQIARARQEIEALDVPAVLLLDLVLSDDSAIDLLRWFRAEPRYERIPVIALASQGLEHHMTRAYALGANSCLLKSLEPQSLSSIVRGIATYATLLRTAPPEPVN